MTGPPPKRRSRLELAAVHLGGGALGVLLLLLLMLALEEFQAREVAHRAALEVRLLEQLPAAVIDQAQRQAPSANLRRGDSFPFRPRRGERLGRFPRMIERALCNRHGLERALLAEPEQGLSAGTVYWLEIRPRDQQHGSPGYWLRLRTPLSVNRLFRPLSALLVLLLGVLLSLLLFLRQRYLSPIDRLTRTLQLHSRSRLPLLQESGVPAVRKLSRRINTLVQQINENDRYQSQLLEALVHDLRGPLSRQLLLLEEMEELTDRSRVQEKLQALARDTRNLITITERLAAVAGQRLPIPEREVLALDEICARIGQSYPGRSLVLSVPHLLVRLRRETFERCLINLLDSALEHGRPPVKVSAECLQREGLLRIAVEDHGEGLRTLNVLHRPRIPPAHDRQRRRHSGLGLAIVERFCLDHGGELALMPSPWAELRLPLSLVERPARLRP